MLFLLEDYFTERTSFFAPYYELLPTSPTELPLFWTEATRSRMRGTTLLDDVDGHSNAAEAAAGVSYFKSTLVLLWVTTVLLSRRPTDALLLERFHHY